jgi:hypothetical protein
LRKATISIRADLDLIAAADALVLADVPGPGRRAMTRTFVIADWARAGAEARGVKLSEFKPEPDALDASLAELTRIVRKCQGGVAYVDLGMSDREFKIAAHRVGPDGGRPATLDATAGAFNLSRERVRQIQERILSRAAARQV